MNYTQNRSKFSREKWEIVFPKSKYSVVILVVLFYKSHKITDTVDVRKLNFRFDKPNKKVFHFWTFRFQTFGTISNELEQKPVPHRFRTGLELVLCLTNLKIWLRFQMFGYYTTEPKLKCPKSKLSDFGR